MAKAVNNYHVWYGFRDEKLVKEINDFRNDSKDAYFSLVVFAGGAGTGKTRVLAKLSTKKGYRFICPTNISGEVMKSTLNSHNLFGSKTFGADATIYKHYGENVNDTAEYEHIIFKGVNSRAASGNLNSLKELFEAFEKTFETVCEMRFQKSNDKFSYISKQEYFKAKENCRNNGWIDHGGEFESENEAVVDYLIASGRFYAKNIPMQLRYHTYVLDEAGRIPCLTGLLMVYYHRWIRRYYGCREDDKHFKPKLICVGSATQNKVINQTRLPINEYSLITMIVAPFFKNEQFLTHLNSFNRRCDKGDIESSAALATLIERVEMCVPVSKKLKDEFLSRFSAPFFIPSCEDMEGENKTDILGRLHIAKQHVVLKNLEKVIKPYLSKVSVTEYFHADGNDEDCERIAYVYRPTERLGSCYQSVTYEQNKWERGFKKIKRDNKEFWRYENSRHLFLNTFYKVTHPINCYLIGIDGSVQDFLNDVDVYQNAIGNPLVMSRLLVQLILYLNRISEMVALYNEDLSRRIEKLPELIETLQNIKEEPDEEKIRRLHLEINTYMYKILEFLPSDEQIPLKISLEGARGCLIFQGSAVIIESICDNYVIVRLGKTMSFRMYRKKCLMKGLSVSDFSTIANRYKETNIKKGRKRKRRASEDEEGSEIPIDDWMSQMISEEIEEVERQQNRCTNLHKAISFYFFPLKLSMIETIDGSQSATYNFNHIVELSQCMPAEDFIVAVTRLTDTNLLKVHISNKKDSWEILPLGEITRLCVKKLYHGQIKKGWI